MPEEVWQWSSLQMEECQKKKFGSSLSNKGNSYFPQNSLSPVEIDWAAEAVDSAIFALVSKSTSKQNTGYCLEGEAETCSAGITTSTEGLLSPEEADRTTSLWLQEHRRDRPRC